MTARDPKDKRKKQEDAAWHSVGAMREDETLLERRLGESYGEAETEQANEMAGLLRHSAHPPRLSTDAFARIGDTLFGADFVVPLERIIESSKDATGLLTESSIQSTLSPVQDVGYSRHIERPIARAPWWSRWLSGLWQASGWRPVWGFAAVGCVFLGVVSLWQTNGPHPTRIEPNNRAQTLRGPWPEGVNPFGVTRDASERLGHVLRYYREQRQDQWIEDLGGSNVR